MYFSKIEHERSPSSFGGSKFVDLFFGGVGKFGGVLHGQRGGNDQTDQAEGNKKFGH